jgi:hypothetical protein
VRHYGNPRVVAVSSPSPGLPAPQILRVPAEIPLHAILLIARPRDAVIGIGIDHQLRGHSQRRQRLVHLLAAGQRDIPIFLPTQKQRRGLDLVGVQERIGDPIPGFQPGLPRRSDLFVILNDVLIDAVQRERKCSPCAACGGLKSRPTCGRSRSSLRAFRHRLDRA